MSERPPHPVMRALASQSDYEACLRLQRATWGDDFRELVAPAILMIAEKTGGIAAGAFTPDGAMAGFVFGITGVVDGTPLHWSHMLAVAADMRDRGIGHRLKLYQRDRLRAAGVGRMRWTFDPLVARNAHLNLDRLGARIVEYVRDMYGDNPNSTTDRVIGSDRFVVEWDLTGAPPPPSPTREAWNHAPAVVTEADPLIEKPRVRIAIPRDIHETKERDPDTARRYRRATRRAFEHYLANGFTVRGFDAPADDPHAYYRLERADA